MRKIAIPLVEGGLCQHFGHCEQFAFITVDEERKIVRTSERATPPPHEPGLLPRWLVEQGVDAVIVGGLGARARSLLESLGVDVVVGAASGGPEELAEAFMTGGLKTGPNVCDH